MKSDELHMKKALECVPLTTKPKNFIEEYFEGIITERGWVNLEEKLRPLIEEINWLKGPLNAQS